MDEELEELRKQAQQERAKIEQTADQAAAYISDTCPMQWHRMHTNLKLAGFEPHLADRVLLTYIHSQFGGKLTP